MATRARKRPRRRGLRYEDRLFALTLLSGAPALAVALGWLWSADFTPKVPLTFTLLLVGIWLGAAATVRERAMRPLQTVSNVIAALAEGDTSLRGHVRRRDDALGLAFLEANRLVEMVREERLRAMEASALLRRVLEAIDLAVFGFDERGRLKLANRTALELLRRSPQDALDLPAADLGLETLLEGDSPRVVELDLPGRAARWEVRRSAFRERGLPHQLVILADLSRTLHAEERLAWRNLVRVLSHEINNSLAPVRSIATTLRELLEEHPLPAEVREETLAGLTIVAERATSLARFLQAYSELARLPEPHLDSVDVGEWVRGVASLEERLPVEVREGRPASVEADRGQLDQLLTHLVNNAVEAALGGGGEVRVAWRANGAALEVSVEDDGPGLADTKNLFVPFYTTKPGGTGVGLALSRQIAEQHGGSLELADRSEGPGARARLRLPLVRRA